MSKTVLITIIVIVLILVVAVAFYLISNMGQNSVGFNKSKFEVEGVKVEVVTQGTGSAIKNGDTATVHYNGTLENGTKFDSSYDRNSPITFALGSGQLIKGFDVGVLGMKVGEKRKITIPSDLGYGVTGIPPVIPPNSNLIFEIELISITPGK